MTVTSLKSGRREYKKIKLVGIKEAFNRRSSHCHDAKEEPLTRCPFANRRSSESQEASRVIAGFLKLDTLPVASYIPAEAWSIRAREHPLGPNFFALY
jgi:hypothetical protein